MPPSPQGPPLELSGNRFVGSRRLPKGGSRLPTETAQCSGHRRSATSQGRRRGRRMGFSRWRKKGQGRISGSFTAGAIRVDDPSHVLLPGSGGCVPHAPTTALLQRLRAGMARLLQDTVGREGGTWPSWGEATPRRWVQAHARVANIRRDVWTKLTTQSSSRRWGPVESIEAVGGGLNSSSKSPWR